MALDRLSVAFDALRGNVDDCGTAGSVLGPLLDAFDLNSVTDGVQSEIDDLNEESLSELASDVGACCRLSV